jgi:hypothetical protein
VGATPGSLRGRPVDPVLWPVDLARLHRRIPTSDPNPIRIDVSGGWRPGSRRFYAVLAAAFLATSLVAVVWAHGSAAGVLGLAGLLLAGFSLWRVGRGPLVYAWIFAEDGLGYRRRDGLVAWVTAERVARVESKVVSSGPYPALVVRVRDCKKHVLLSARPGGVDPAELLAAAARKGLPVADADAATN